MTDVSDSKTLLDLVKTIRDRDAEIKAAGEDYFKSLRVVHGLRDKDRARIAALEAALGDHAPLHPLLTPTTEQPKENPC